MNSQMLPPATYDTETVRQMLGLPNAQDVRNLTRKGAALHRALIARGRFDVRKVRRARAQFIRRRLAASLGRTSPRFLPDSHSRECPQCGGIAVLWNGIILCENDHKTPG